MNLRADGKTDAAEDLWRQIFDGLAKREDAAVWDPAYDSAEDERRLREGFRGAGWSDAEINRRIALEAARMASAPDRQVNPGAQFIYKTLCDDVEGAMGRLGFTSQHNVARGIEPRVGPFAAKTSVIMTDQSIITVGAFMFRFCGLIARAFTRTLHLNPYFWSSESYSPEEGRRRMLSRPRLLLYWAKIYLSFALTGTQIMAPYKPSTPHEVLLFEQIARAMELFAVAHEYGHHHKGHGRVVDERLAHAEEYEADQFALRIAWDIAEQPDPLPNPYIASGAGGVILLLAMTTLRKAEDIVAGASARHGDTHPGVAARVAKFDTVALLRPATFKVLREFRTTAQRIMDVVESIVLESIGGLNLEGMRALSDWKFRDR